MLSFHVVNLLIPGDPPQINLTLASGNWTLEQQPELSEGKGAIAKGQCGNVFPGKPRITLGWRGCCRSCLRRKHTNPGCRILLDRTERDDSAFDTEQ
jgi:hypothetical protein